MSDKAAGPYIVWEDYGGIEGWCPKSYATAEDAVRAICDEHGGRRVVTRLLELKVVNDDAP